MSDMVTYSYEDSISTIRLDDGRVNCCSPAMMTSINRALDQAEKDGGVVLLIGKEGAFSAGFDLGEFKKGPEARLTMVKMGAQLVERLFAFPKPVVIACTGHAIAMGSFMLAAATVRIGAEGSYKIGANEVTIGMAVPRFATEVCRHRLSKRYQSRALLTGELFSPQGAVEAGFLDFAVAPEQLEEEARTVAVRLAGLDDKGYQETLLRLRGESQQAIRAAIAEDYNQ